MKYFFIIILFITPSTLLYAQAPWRTNKLREAKKTESIRAQIDEIPLYEEKLTGNYDILGPVRGQDMLTKKKEAIFYQIRQTAWKMGADAVMEIECKPILKTVFQSCEGFAIKYR